MLRHICQKIILRISREKQMIFLPAGKKCNHSYLNFMKPLSVIISRFLRVFKFFQKRVTWVAIGR